MALLAAPITAGLIDRKIAFRRFVRIGVYKPVRGFFLPPESSPASYFSDALTIDNAAARLKPLLD